MSIVFSKNKEKRSRSSTSESNNSFVKNVTSRVSGLLPATITKWFSSPSSSSANGSAPAADTTDSSTEDEGPDSPVITQPPAKRMRYSSGSKYNQYTPPEAPTPCHSDSPDLHASNLYTTIQSSPGRSAFLREPNYVSTPYMVLHPGAEVASRDIVNTERTDREITYSSPHIVSATNQSVALKRKSIFETPVSNRCKEETLKSTASEPSAGTSKEVKQPYYKPAYFGSPFYHGRTMYGGASSATYINQPNIKHQKVPYVRESTNDNDKVNMSYSARKVMDLLENYSSPLMEAKRIPVIRKGPLNAYNNYTMSSDVSLPSTSHGYSYKKQELNVPSIASILRIKQRSRLMETTKVARQIIASHSSTLSGFQPFVDDQNIYTNKEAEKEGVCKMKTRLTRLNRGEDQFEMPKPVQLPTAVLQIDKDNLPKFSMSPPSGSASLHSSYTPSNFQPLFASAAPTHTTAVSYKNSTARAKTFTTESPPRGNIFKFASPVTISADSPLNTATTSTKFTFGSPERTVDNPKKSEEKTLQSNSKKTETPAFTMPKPSKSEWNCPDCMVKNNDVEKCLCCSAKRPTVINSTKRKPDKCMVCKFANSLPDANKCINCEKASIQGNNSIPLPIPQPADPSKWKCEGCWVSNEEKADKCACCGTRNTKVAVAPGPIKPTEVEKDWKCEDCWISNKSSVDKCAACGGVKPGGKPNVVAAPAPQSVPYSPFAAPPDKKLAEIAKAQKAKWECPGCLVRNDPDKQECLCCGMEREGLSKEKTAKPFNFPKESNIHFKFGIDPKVQETNIAKKIESPLKPEPTRKLEELETNNNNIPTFTFTLPNKKLDAVESVKSSVPKMAFTFGIPKTTPALEAPAVPSFTASPKAQVDGKPQEVPKEDFRATSPETGKSFGTGFFTPPSSQPAQEKTPKFPSFTASSTPVQSKESAVCNEQPKTHLSFGLSSQTKAETSSVGKAEGLFGGKTTTASSSGFSFGTSQQSTPSTMVSTARVFQNPEASISVPAPTMTMFGASQPTIQPSINNQPSINQPTTTSTNVPNPTPAVPLFGFGSNTQTAAPVPDKPKFNFSFGTNNTETNSTFGGFKPVPAFGSTDNNAQNAFTMPAPGPMIANPLNTNSMTTENVLGSNSMSTSMGGEVGGTMQSFTSTQENVWGTGAGTSPNVFGNNSSSLQKPAPFNFGTPNPFNGGAAANPSQPASSLFGNQQSVQNPFSMTSGANSAQAGIFGSPAQNNQPANLFGNTQPTTGMFGAAATQPFGASAVPAPTFEAPAQAQAPQPAFNFGAQQSSGVFGFGAQTQQAPAQQQQGGVYNFGGGGGGGGSGMSPAMGGGMMGQGMGGGVMGQGMGGVQFNMGSAGAGATSVRRLRKAVRRNPPR